MVCEILCVSIDFDIYYSQTCMINSIINYLLIIQQQLLRNKVQFSSKDY